jgi:hypothetical protein
MGTTAAVRRAVVALAAVSTASVLVACTPGSGAEALGPGPWKWREVRTEAVTRSQGLATDPVDGAAADTWYTSQFTIERTTADGSSLGVNGSLPPSLIASGKYSHSGDPDVLDGRLVVPYENKQFGPSDPPAKAWGVFDADSLQLLGTSRHVLDPGETSDDPWVTISPDGRWIVSGNYSPLGRLEVFPVPAAPYADLPLASTVPVDDPPSSVQGCDFVDDTELVCASNDEASGQQVFTLSLDAPIGGGATEASITYRGPAPQAAPLLPSPVGDACLETGEVEGVDAHRVAGLGTVVRVLVVDRCLLVVHEYSHVIPD